MKISKALEIVIKDPDRIGIGYLDSDDAESKQFNEENQWSIITLLRCAQAWITLQHTLETSKIPWDWKYTKNTVDKIIEDIEKENQNGND